ncbi:MAG: DHA2 family efflux MFS transporter permease subunit [Blastocatellia bacterium]
MRFAGQMIRLPSQLATNQCPTISNQRPTTNGNAQRQPTTKHRPPTTNHHTNQSRMNTEPSPISHLQSPIQKPWLIALAVMSATFMEVLDTSVANVSLPHIAGTLSASTDEATWVLTSYLISNAIILPATGWLSSFFGRKRLLIACTIIFTVSSALCGAAPSLSFLIVARILQGIGGGVLQPTAQAVMMESFSLAKRGQAMAIYSIGVIVAPIVGPTLGGWITDNYSWRWIFYINVPVGIISVLLTQKALIDPPHLRRIARNNIDYIGFGLMALALGGFQLVLDKGQHEDWFASAFILWLTVIACAALVGFVIRELRVAEPIVDLRILGNRNFGMGTLLVAVAGAVLYGVMAQLPMFLQSLMGYTAVESGMAVSPRGIGAMISMLSVGRMIGKLDGRWLMACGFATLGVSVWLLGDINLEITQATVIWPNIVSGLAIGFVFVPLTTLTMSTLRTEQIGYATGLFSLLRNLGGGIGISVGATTLARGAQIHQAALAAHLTPYDAAFQQRWQQVQGALSTQLGALGSEQVTNATMYGTLLRQARLLAFIDNFRSLGLLCLLCIPLVFLFKKVQPRGTKIDVH